VVAPGYYRGVYSSGRDPWFDPVAVGTGLGLTQGVTCGLFVGGVVVFSVAWYNARRNPFAVDGRPVRPLPSAAPAEGSGDDERITRRSGS
jgi:hypothetical protein